MSTVYRDEVARLIVHTGGVDQLVELGERTFIGRHPSNDVQLLDDGVSGRHCLIEMHDGHYHVRDLNSRNGTYLNNLRNDGNEARLHHHDLIVAGSTVMRFEHEASGLRVQDVEEELVKLRRDFEQLLARSEPREPRDSSAWVEHDPESDTRVERDTLRRYWEATQQLAAARDEEALLEALLDGAIACCAARGGSIRVYDEDGGYVVATSRGDVVSDSDVDVDRARSVRRSIARRSSRPNGSWGIVLPLYAGERELGMMCLDAMKGNDLKHVLLAETLASLAARMLDALRLRLTLH